MHRLTDRRVAYTVATKKNDALKPRHGTRVEDKNPNWLMVQSLFFSTFFFKNVIPIRRRISSIFLCLEIIKKNPVRRLAITYSYKSFIDEHFL